MTFREELLQCVARVAAHGPLPPIATVYIPQPAPSPDRNAEFGLLALADGSAGLYYAWMGETQRDMASRLKGGDLRGRQVTEIALRYASDDEGERSLALAAIGALTAHVFRRAGYTPPAATDSMAGLDPKPGESLGFIGNFPPLVRQARALGVQVTVLERKAHMRRDEPGLRITLDPSALHACSAVIGTGAMLINDSLEETLAHCQAARRIALLGPTAGVFPDALFARGVAAVGGLRILDLASALTRLRAQEKLGASAQRFLIEAADYPGLSRLLDDS